MFRKLLPVTAVLFLAPLAPADDKPAGGRFAGKIDKAKLFDRIDANGDGKISKDEFTKFRDAIKEKLKDKGVGDKLPEGFGDKLFDKMDADGDGFVSKAEFEKFEMPGKGKKKADEK